MQGSWFAVSVSCLASIAELRQHVTQPGPVSNSCKRPRKHCDTATVHHSRWAYNKDIFPSISYNNPYQSSFCIVSFKKFQDSFSIFELYEFLSGLNLTDINCIKIFYLQNLKFWPLILILNTPKNCLPLSRQIQYTPNKAHQLIPSILESW